MGWVRVSDDFYDHPKFADVTPLSIALWIAGLAYCNRNRTDGYISESVAARLMDFNGLAYTVATIGDLGGVMESDCGPLATWDLIKVGLWHDDGHDCTRCPQPGPKKVYVHDYLVFQPSADDIKTKTEVRSVAGKIGASARWPDGKAHGKADGKADGKAHGKADGKADGKIMPQSQSQAPTKATTKTPSPADADAAFDAFWLAYPRKVGKAAARKAWKSATKETAPTIVAAGLQAQLPKLLTSEERFRPHPATWLNEGRWEDEAAAPRKAAGWWDNP